MKLVNFRRLKSAVGHEYVNENEVLLKHYQSPTNFKIKFTLEKTWTGSNSDTNDSGWPRDDLDDRETILTDQGGAVVPDGVTIHKIERPVTHWLVKTEVSRLIIG